MANLFRRQQCKLYVTAPEQIVFQLFCTLSQVTYESRIETKDCSFLHLSLGIQMSKTAKEIVITCKSLRSFSVFVRVTLKSVTRSDGINH